MSPGPHPFEVGFRRPEEEEEEEEEAADDDKLREVGTMMSELLNTLERRP